MDWDKNFGGDGDGLLDDMASGMRNPAMMSEFEQIQEEKVQLVKCGITLWRSITFALYMVLVIVVYDN